MPCLFFCVLNLLFCVFYPTSTVGGRVALIQAILSSPEAKTGSFLTSRISGFFFWLLYLSTMTLFLHVHSSYCTQLIFLKCKSEYNTLFKSIKREKPSSSSPLHCYIQTLNIPCFLCLLFEQHISSYNLHPGSSIIASHKPSLLSLSKRVCFLPPLWSLSNLLAYFIFSKSQASEIILYIYSFVVITKMQHIQHLFSILSFHQCHYIFNIY